MAELITNTARLVPYAKRPRGNNGYVAAYVHEPAPDDPAIKYGSLYVVTEVLVNGRAGEDTTDIIIETFGNAYYNSQEQPFPLARFEHAVKQTNTALAKQIDKGNAAWIGKLSCVIAVIAGDEVHITHAGSGEGFLYRGKSHTRITTPSNGRAVAATKTFGSIASGELEPGDRLLFSTPALIHNVPLAKLGTVINSHTPQGAIAEFTALLGGRPSDRVAAIVTQITTPELAALALRTDEPDVVELGAPQNAVEAAKIAAGPLASDAVQSTAKLAKLARDNFAKTTPLTRRAGLTAAAIIRRILSTTLGRQLAAAGVIVLVLLASASWYMSDQAKKSANLLSEYQQIYHDYQLAQNQPDGQQLDTLTSVQSRLAKLAAQEKPINQLLANSSLLDGEPTTYQAFRAAVSARVNNLHGLTSAEPTTVGDLAHTSQTPHFVEQAGGKLYVIGTGSAASIQIINPTTGKVTAAQAVLTNVGTIKATTLSAAGDGLFLLTDKPGIWFYSFASDSLVQQTVAYGSWTAGSALGSYLSNLYILGTSSVDKFVKSGTGYAPKTTALALTSKAPSTMAVDGSIYTLTDSTLTEYVAGSPKQSVAMPTAVSGLSNLRSFSSGKVLVASSASAGRIVVFTSTAGKLDYKAALNLTGIKAITDATYDAKTGKLYIIADNRLVSAPLPL